MIKNKEKFLLFFLFLIFSLVSKSLSFNCRINPNDICEFNTICNESGICVCNDFYYGEKCEKKLENLDSININKGIGTGGFLTWVLCLTLIGPVSLILGFYIIFIFLKGRDATYIN